MSNKEGPNSTVRQRIFHSIGGFLYKMAGGHLYEGMSEQEVAEYNQGLFGVATGLYSPGGSREKVLKEWGMLEDHSLKNEPEVKARPTIQQNQKPTVWKR